MASLNSDNVIKSIGGENNSFKTPKTPKKSGKNNTQVYILIGLILFCIVGGYLLFGGSTKEAESLPKPATAETNTNKEVLPPPPLPDKKAENEAPAQAAAPAPKEANEAGLNKEQISDLFNQSAINEALNTPAPKPQEPKQEEPQEPQKGGKWVSAPQVNKQSTMDAVVQNAKRGNEQEEESKTSLDKLKDNVIMKVNYFTYGGKNYYEGDKILNYKIKEVTKNKVTLQDENKKIITLNFGSKR
ncbi:hypothetical protein [Campylobacter concisus]|uniref:hypothetical protein n=1 Tax=Campylobacter concisus TaxID=199 RepID=UPI0011E670BD|nr:hypothetical protein [Campylobacter concisus]